ncbi:MAG: molybdenum cofactor biosynthesis protein MoaB [Candidatus Lokiarchaeota archaeon]|nr:molybdenum cofactor biosynthesis protein MoaB [Candidatus Lokiarchaeota archaeon]
MKTHEEHKLYGPKKVNIALVVVSTSRFKELKLNIDTTDKTIPLVKKILMNKNDIILKTIKIIPDSKDYILNTLDLLLKKKEINSIVFSGGTGLSKKDITYDIIQPRLEKEILGFGEIFRFLSYQEIGSSSVLSRATAGVIFNKVIFLLPGSPNAVKLAFCKIIIPEIKHMTYIINKKE